jgi:hypothetical protein
MFKFKVFPHDNKLEDIPYALTVALAHPLYKSNVVLLPSRCSVKVREKFFVMEKEPDIYL